MNTNFKIGQIWYWNNYKDVNHWEIIEITPELIFIKAIYPKVLTNINSEPLFLWEKRIDPLSEDFGKWALSPLNKILPEAELPFDRRQAILNEE